jgi:Fe2+ or Zn2+ uptake regulation protein
MINELRMLFWTNAYSVARTVKEYHENNDYNKKMLTPKMISRMTGLHIAEIYRCLLTLRKDGLIDKYHKTKGFGVGTTERLTQFVNESETYTKTFGIEVPRCRDARKKLR